MRRGSASFRGPIDTLLFLPFKGSETRGEREEEEEENERRERLFHPNPRQTGSDLGVKAERGRPGREEEEKQLYSSFPERIDFIFQFFSPPFFFLTEFHLLIRNSIFFPLYTNVFLDSRAKLTAANWKVWDSFSWRFFFVFFVRWEQIC